MARNAVIARCIVRAIANHGDERKKRSLIRRILSAFAALFALYNVPLRKFKDALFAELRKTAWYIDEADYKDSFIAKDDAREDESLQTMGTMGYSGSTFFSTADKAYLVKSIPRHFEHSFFREDLLEPYAKHMAEHQNSILVRICDLLSAKSSGLGTLLGTAPSHHIIMENLLYGQAEAQQKGASEWETWDLKPTSYFFPERDVASGALASEATKSRLADEFHEKLILNDDQAQEFMTILERDTKLLQDCNAVDYSLFLVRFQEGPIDPFQDESVVPDQAPFVPPAAPSWRTGMESADGKYVYRAVILDFFWAKHKSQPKVMTALIKAYNMLDRQGPMSITTTATEYRTRFLDMCKGFIEVPA
ncbi:SAICAR synthase-like protein [Myriangium duriaei CBS 260.36]|uniref:SAICAR synthase-like protein n=1 Tax=Myriangium duriaei CBS 260.36 TaxID=1168546 RepID=A0A9P4J508_9PEZI|nr:SAICAR synthase-like protein [Myriangium duriaei CBS 260.36]